MRLMRLGLGRRLPTGAALFALLLAAAAPAAETGFPFPAFKNDFFAFIRAAEAYAKAEGKGQSSFANLTLPFAPLDISHGGKAEAGALRDYRNFVFGVLAAVFQADPRARHKDYFCQEACWKERETRLKGSLGQIRALAEKARQLPEVMLVSHWNKNDGFRVNDWFFSAARALLAEPSRELRMKSSGSWAEPNAGDLASIKELRSRAEPLVAEMRKLGLVALVKKKDGSVAVVADGFADNAWGLLLSPPDEKRAPPHSPDDQLSRAGEGAWIFRKGGRKLLTI